MKRKLLKFVPLVNVTDEEIKEIAKRNREIKYVLFPQRKIIDGHLTLAIDVYRAVGGVSLEYRMYFQLENYVTLDVKLGKWRTGCIENILTVMYWYKGTALAFRTDNDRQMVEQQVLRFLGKSKEEKWNTIDCIYEYQHNIRDKRLCKRHKEETDRIDEEMKVFGEVPSDYDYFLKVRVFESDNYLFFDRSNKDAYCTNCDKSFEITDRGTLRHRSIAVWDDKHIVRHNKFGVCPYCNKHLEFKSIGMGRKNLTKVRWSVLVQPNHGEVLVRYFRHIKSFEDWKNPKVETTELFRSVHSCYGSTDYMWERYKSSNNVRWCYQKNISSYNYFGPSEYVVPREVYLYNVDIDSTLADTCMKYSCAGTMLEYIKEREGKMKHWIVDQYLNDYRKMPWLEQVVKCGFLALANEILHGYNREIKEFKNGRTICETLGITKNMFNLLREIKEYASLHHITILKDFHRIIGRDPNKEEFDILRNLPAYVYNGHIMFIENIKYASARKLNKYIYRSGIKHEEDYFEYLKWLDEMGYDMKNEFNLFPKDFNKAHDQKSKEYEAFIDKKNQEEIEKCNKFLEQMRIESMEDDPVNLAVSGLFIRLPNNLDELRIEGEQLHHCVGTYKKKVANGETMILFVRKKEEPDKAYFTLEYKKDHVEQCRGLHNCDMPPKVQAFVNLFEEKMAMVKERKTG